MTAYLRRVSIAPSPAARLAASLMLVGVSWVLALTGAPSAPRWIALVVLVVVPGVNVVRLMFGRVSATPHRHDVASPGADAVVRALLAAVFGITVSLFVALTQSITGMAITAASLAIGVGVVTMVLSVASWRQDMSRRGQVDEPGGVRAAPRTSVVVEVATRWPTMASVAGGGAAVVLAFVIADAAQPQVPERYTSLGFVDSKPFSAERHVVAPATLVRLDWLLRGFGCDISPPLTSVQVRVDGTPADDVALDIGPLTAPGIAGATGAITGAVTFPAPRAPGRHPVVVTVVPAAADGTPLPDPGFLTAFVEVGA
jgi:hypothetical protein